MRVHREQVLNIISILFTREHKGLRKSIDTNIDAIKIVHYKVGDSLPTCPNRLVCISSGQLEVRGEQPRILAEGD